MTHHKEVLVFPLLAKLTTHFFLVSFHVEGGEEEQKRYLLKGGIKSGRRRRKRKRVGEEQRLSISTHVHARIWGG